MTNDMLSSYSVATDTQEE